ncbi:tRNA preQ1(34) S-adenosylmethionine ribosyltransferase-isomerase QueA [Candidatus Uabimicrobium amorphum]|uniref:S-adenosylmethionine:tRNA ribosyltransferase-isomerase n=1 Tax=Uabimicrobium amorphum TaxID=2596890 RepID=A0A5S9IR97_UABAM|nr:tRNA preQ1(34) S-adenosylmethionine ribosyltransferase-isomerase QueA [Candidatus Uabimicrobium amorphum]BBM85700.1 S-adenosylmethionine:tRNAribosyltransferase-isomerase [Candidatus Uabimicrobium amorphum]
MDLSEFDYELPQELIAQTPVDNRVSSRLMVLNRREKTIDHHDSFAEIIHYFEKGDVLVINTTKVIPAKLIGKRMTGARVEMLVIEMEDHLAKVFIKTRKRPSAKEQYLFGNYNVTVVERQEQHWVVDFGENNVLDVLNELGEPPLPPYIKRKNVVTQVNDQDRYQTVYANEPGAIAAPTAGLHFSVDLLQQIKERGVIVQNVLLHVGLGTFLPIKTQNILQHKMHEEYYNVSPQTATTINEAVAGGNRVVCVGTTSCRALESCASDGAAKAQSGITDIFIYPGYQFQVMNALVTNFHLPKSTLLLLIAAFADKDFILKAYKEAIDKKYRFFSYGDAMLIL